MCYSALDNPADRRLSQRLKANVFRNVKYKTWPPIFLRSNFKKSSLPLFLPPGETRGVRMWFANDKPPPAMRGVQRTHLSLTT
jgi:hypothetical protein